MVSNENDIDWSGFTYFPRARDMKIDSFDDFYVRCCECELFELV